MEPKSSQKKVIVVGGGFGGLAATETLGGHKEVSVHLLDKRNHHLFQPLLYQVAMAGLNPSDIAFPLRRYFSSYENVRVTLSEVEDVDLKNKRVFHSNEWESFDYLILSCGASHSYFGNDQWEPYAPGLKTIEQATEIRRRVLLAFENAEKCDDPVEQAELLTFVIVGGGPTGVELAGAIIEMARKTLAKDFRSVDLTQSRVLLVEGGPRVLAAFPDDLSDHAKKDLENMGVEVKLNTMVTDVSDKGVCVGESQWIQARTVIWAAGVLAAELSKKVDNETTKTGRLSVEKDLSLKGAPDTFVIGDQASFIDDDGNELPGLAPVALQQGQWAAKNILRSVQGQERKKFEYNDKGSMATIGRTKAVAMVGRLHFTGFLAWVMWCFIHVLFIAKFRNRIFVLMQWLFSYFKFGRGARLIVSKKWQAYNTEDASEKKPKT